jgi:XTP/dITP diphosphohydrolase
MIKNNLQLLIATKNAGKVLELEDLLRDLPVDLKNLRQFPDIGDVEETGATFTENAELKAQSYARQCNLWALADDSGLEVAALGGAPGIFSARYGGKNATNEEKIKKLLREIENLQIQNRSARFICTMALADNNGNIRFAAEGICEGEISHEPHGANGFGYDPIFIPFGYEQTFGELSDEIKRKISHRARAFDKIIRYLQDLINSGLDPCRFRL